MNLTSVLPLHFKLEFLFFHFLHILRVKEGQEAECDSVEITGTLTFQQFLNSSSQFFRPHRTSGQPSVALYVRVMYRQPSPTVHVMYRLPSPTVHVHIQTDSTYSMSCTDCHHLQHVMYRWPSPTVHTHVQTAITYSACTCHVQCPQSPVHLHHRHKSSWPLLCTITDCHC